MIALTAVGHGQQTTLYALEKGRETLRLLRVQTYGVSELVREWPVFFGAQSFMLSPSANGDGLLLSVSRVIDHSFILLTIGADGEVSAASSTTDFGGINVAPRAVKEGIIWGAGTLEKPKEVQSEITAYSDLKQIDDRHVHECF